MSRKEYCERLTALLAAGLKADREGRTADKCRIFAEHDDMCNHPENYVDEFMNRL